MAATVMNPKPLVVFRVVHDTQDVNDSLRIVHAPNQPEAIIAYVENDAIPNLISRSERWLEGRKVCPVSVFRQFVPSREIPPGCRGIVFSRFPKLPQPPFGNDVHSPPYRLWGTPSR